MTGGLKKKRNEVEEMLKSLLIVQLAKAGIPQPDIRKIVGCDIWRVSEIARHFKKKKTRKLAVED
jgi:hypothetical protein